MKYDTGEGTPYGRNYLARMEDIVVIDHRQKWTLIGIDTALPTLEVFTAEEIRNALVKKARETMADNPSADIDFGFIQTDLKRYGWYNQDPRWVRANIPDELIPLRQEVVYLAPARTQWTQWKTRHAPMYNRDSFLRGRQDDWNETRKWISRVKFKDGIYWSSEFGFVKQLLDLPEELEIQWDGTYRAACRSCGRSYPVDNAEELQSSAFNEFYCGGSPSYAQAEQEE